MKKCRGFGRFYSRILEIIEKDGGLTFLVVDPPNQNPEIAGLEGKIASEAGVDAIAVGGSVGAQGKLLDDTIERIRENSDLPIILFPGNIASISPKADAVYFMSMLNSVDPYYITGAQIASALPIKKMGLEAIATSYIVIEPGRAVGWVGRAQLIPRELPYLAGITALAGQMMGSQIVILESGGGAEKHAPLEMISATRNLIDIPLVVAGGVKTKENAFECIKAGADIVHVGTAVENVANNRKKALETLKGISVAVKKAGREKKP
ncbi:MAG: geranylgeranylglyceryl/heptaprenylglyceryl phosphate synthase [Candidatus Diapherotrites archaeon]